MLATKDSRATIAVKNLKQAREFYEGKLGLPVTYEDSEAVGYTTGNTSLLVYESEYAGSNQATGVTWVVGDQLQAIMEELRGKGVSFEHYELPGVTREGDLHVMGDMKGAWFKDPDGNIHSLVSGMPAERLARQRSLQLGEAPAGAVGDQTPAGRGAERA